MSEYSTDTDNSPDTEGAPPAAAPKADQTAISQQELTRLRRLLWVFGLLVALLIAPFLVKRIQYALTVGEERAKLEVAREFLPEFNLSKLSTASRLLAHYVGPSVVNIRTRQGRAEGQGSGVIVDEEGYIVTNLHVVEGVRSVEIQLSDGRIDDATVVIGADPLVDVAVLKTELNDLTPAKWGDSDELDVGDMVWAVGSPFGLQKSVTFGIVSAKERRGIARARRGGSIYQEFLQTDAAVNPGNSGGPLINDRGEVVGINTAIIGMAYQGISFSIPSTIARASYEQLRDNGWVRRGYLGIRPSKLGVAEARELELEPTEGVLVVEVEPNTPAEEAGLQEGDVILSWDGTHYDDPTLMSRAIAATEIGAQVPVEIVRREGDELEYKTLQVTVAVRPPDSL